MTKPGTQRVDVIVAVDGEVIIEQHLEVASFELEASSWPYLADVGDGRRIDIAAPDRAFSLDIHHGRRVEPPLGWADDEFSLTKLFGRIPGQVSFLMARWYADKGWLVTRRGIVRHGLKMPINEAVKLEADTGLRAMERKAKTEGLEW